MISLLKRHKKAVSPVIAVVLLIALTVAATAIIWFVTNNYLNTGTASLVASDQSAETLDDGAVNTTHYLKVDVKFTASEQISISDISLEGSSASSLSLLGVDVGAGSNESLSVTVDQGETTVSIWYQHDTVNSTISSGQYTVEYTFAPTSGGSNQINEFTVSVS